MISEQAPPGAPLHLPPGGLVDRFGRRITYLRLSITDRCDFRCTYCMAEEMTFLPHGAVLSLEEALRLVRIFVSLGVTKVRITGGEPLVRRNALWLLQEIGRLQGLKELVLTTNGSQLARHAADLRRAGVSRLNISLDTLRPERFRAITRIGDLTKVLDGVEAALAAGFSRIRLNAVMQQGVNDDELGDLLAYAVARNIDLALIEEMPLGDTGHDRSATFLSSDAARARLAERFELIPTLENSGGPARYWRVGGSDSRVGFISPHSHNFCDTCNRVRISAQGTLYPCLGDDGAIPLLPLLRAHPQDDALLGAAIATGMGLKAQGHDFTAAMATPKIVRFMSSTGG